MSEPRDLRDHIIVCGLHGVGLLSVEQLVHVGRRVVVIDPHPEPRHQAALAAMDVPLVVADPRDPEVLNRAGLTTATAVLCVQRDDLDTLATALLVHELRADIRLAVRLDNTGVGGALASMTGIGTVLNRAGIAAPSIVEACQQTTDHKIEIDGTTFVVAELVAPRTQSLRRQFGDLAPIAIAPNGGGPLVICPGRDQLATGGDRVTVVGTEEQIRDWRPDAAGSGRDSERRLSLTAGIRRMRHDIAGLFGEIDRGLRTALIVIAALVAVSTVVLRFGYRNPGGGHMSVLNALYFTVSTDATVGYGDFNYRGQPHWLVAFGIADIVMGAALATMLFALLTNLLVSRRLAQALGRKRITGMVDHVVLIGLGTVGMEVLEGLRRSRDVVVIESNDDGRFVSQARALGVPVVIGDATLPQTLDLVNLDGASAVAVLTSNDFTNVEIALALGSRLARARRNTPMVVRLFDRQLARSVERTFDFRHVRSTSALAAPWFVGAALGLDVLDTFYVDRQPFLLGRLTVAVGGGLEGRMMRELSARTRVLALHRAAGDLEHPPRRDTVFAAGDAAYIVGPYEELLSVLLSDLRPVDGFADQIG
ncbi:MAG TPA: NAD-binding protein [Mycobacteriales bacterium]|nr:NAD-binding protein [Mycobacteriales bacterium]